MHFITPIPTTQYRIRKALLQGTISSPPSKSHTLRAILFGALGQGKTIVYNPLLSPDTQAMITACQLLGATIEQRHNSIEIEGIDGTVIFAEDVINAGNSGLVLRLIAATAALASHPIVITGDHSLRHQRPMQSLLEGLRQLGVVATSTKGDGYAPIIIQGPLQQGTVVIAGEDSQPISALLIAALFVEGKTEIIVHNPGEKPWLSLTLDWFDCLGLSYERYGFERYVIFGKQRYRGFTYHVPGDWSSAAFPIAAALITDSELMICNVDIRDCQGDKQLIAVLQQMGAIIEIDSKAQTLHVKKGSELTGVTVDINDFIDALPILAVVACFAKGNTHITNAAIAKKKECDRLHCIALELNKMGAAITEIEDGLKICPAPLKGTTVFSHYDHRIAMSLAVAALGAEGETQINSVNCISKTFSTFVCDFNALGANIKVYEDLAST